MKKKNVIGVDVSKMTLDVVFKNNHRHLQISNDEKGFKLLMKEIKALKLSLEECLVVMEHTGIYSYRFESFLAKHQLAFTKVPALQIKRSMGIVRGKNDKADAKMIADFGQLHHQALKLNLPAPEMNYLRSLLSQRERMVSQKAGYLASIKEQSRFLEIKKSSLLLKSSARLIKVLEKQIMELEQEIKQIIAKEEKMQKNYDLLVSVTAVGFVLASHMILATHNFTLFTDPKKFASYSGVAPFDHSSGTSLRKRSRVSHLANKKIKTLLDLAAKCAIIHDPELKCFYNRRVLAGKSKMSTINIVRNKLIQRMFAVIKRESPFQKNYQQVA